MYRLISRQVTGGKKVYQYVKARKVVLKVLLKRELLRTIYELALWDTVSLLVGLFASVPELPGCIAKRLSSANNDLA